MRFLAVTLAGVLFACSENVSSFEVGFTRGEPLAQTAAVSFPADKYTEAYSGILTNSLTPPPHLCTSCSEGSEYWLNDSAISKDEYLARVQDYEQRDLSRSTYTQPIVDRPPMEYPYDGWTYRFSYGSTIPFSDSRYTSITTINSQNGMDQIPESSLRGNGVSVYWMGEALPLPSGSPNVVQPDYRNYRRLPEDILSSTRQVQLIGVLAPNVCITGIDFIFNYVNGHQPILPNNPMVNDIRSGCGSYYLGAHVFNDTSNHNIGYNAEAAVLDDYIYNTRVIMLASNGELYGTRFHPNSAGSSHNAISVAGISTQTLLLASIATMPQVVNADKIFLPSESQIVVKRHLTVASEYTTYMVDDPITGSMRSAAAKAYTAGMLANLLSDHPFYRWHPEVVKALMLTTNVSNGGTPDYGAMTHNNVSRYWVGGNGDHFVKADSANVEEIYVPDAGPVREGATWRMAIAWLTRGDYPLSHESLQQEMSLSVNVLNARGEILESYTADKEGQGHQVLNFKIPAGATRVEYAIRRTKNKGGRTLLGFNLHIE